MTAELTIERAVSDYLAVSRRFALYGPGEYEQAEERAWDRLQRTIAAEEGVADRLPEVTGA